MTQISVFSSKHCIKYPNIPSEIRPVPHDGILAEPKPKPPENLSLEEFSNDDLLSCSRNDPD